MFGGAEFGPTGEGFYRAISGVASSFAIELNPIRVGSPADIERKIEIFARASDGGLVAAADGGPRIIGQRSLERQSVIAFRQSIRSVTGRPTEDWRFTESI